MRPTIVRILLLCAAALLLASCAATSLVDTWRNPGLAGQRYQKLLVLSITKNDSARRVYEDVLTAELRERGVDAVPGYNLITGYEKGDKQTLEKAVKESGAQGVFTVQTIRVEKQTAYQPGYIENYPGYWYPPAFPAWNMYGYWGATTYYEPPTAYTYEVATIQANLFDAASGKLIWAATLETSEPGKVLSVSKELARLVIEKLSREGLI